MTTKDRFNYLTFSDWNAMYHFITSEGDLYNPFLNKYAFTYNNDGAICVYDVTPAEAVELVEQSVENHELWSAFLGTGGRSWIMIPSIAIMSSIWQFPMNFAKRITIRSAGCGQMIFSRIHIQENL